MLLGFSILRVATLILLTMIVLVMTGQGNKRAPADSLEVAVTLKAEKKRYRPNEPITLKYGITNVGTRPFYLHPRISSSMSHEGDFELSVLNLDTGKSNIAGWAGTRKPYDPNLDLPQHVKNNWVLLRPKQTYWQSEQWLSSPSTPGKYEIRGKYHNSLFWWTKSQQEHQNQLKFPLLLGTYPSNAIEIEISR